MSQNYSLRGHSEFLFRKKSEKIVSRLRKKKIKSIKFADIAPKSCFWVSKNENSNIAILCCPLLSSYDYFLNFKEVTFIVIKNNMFMVESFRNT